MVWLVVMDLIKSHYHQQRWVRNMLASESITKNYLYLLFALSLLTWSIVFVLFILIIALAFTALDGGTPLTATCTAAYHIAKYAQVYLMLQLAFICTIICLVAFSALVVILVLCVLRAKDSQQPNIFISTFHKISLYLLAALSLLASIPAFGYYLNFLVQLGSCTNSYNYTNVSVIFAFAAMAFVLLLAILILLFIFFAVRPEEKYREVENNSTEPREKVEKIQNLQHYKRPIDEPYKKNPETYQRTPQEPERNSPPRRVANRGEELEHTKQNLYSPPRQPAINVYSKEVDPQPLIRPIPIPERRPEPAPLLEPRTYKKQTFQPEHSRNAPSSNEGELIFSKSRHRGTPDDEHDFAKEQNKFMSKYGGRPILPSSGVQEVNREKRYNKDYFHDDLYQRKAEDKSSSPKKGREGNLLNYIRGKYGN